MKKWSKALLVTLLCTFVVMLLALPGSKADAASKVKLSSSKITIAVGESNKLSMKGTKKKVTWTTSNKRTAKVSKGKVTGVKKGKATITAKVGNKKYTCKVNVEAPKLSATKLKLNVGKTAKLKLNGNSRKVSWSTSNKRVAKVYSGKINAAGAGQATITAKVGSRKYTCKVTVSKPAPKPVPKPTPKPQPVKIPVQSVRLNQTSITLIVKNSYHLTAVVTPGNATNKKVSWSSSNNTVASVDQNGNVKANAGGVATIYAKCDGKTATCTVYVSEGLYSYRCLAEYIEKNGKTNPLGNKFIIYDDKVGTMASIIYDKAENKFQCTMFLTYTEGITVVGTMDINPYNMSTVNVSISSIYSNNSSKVKAVVSFNPTTYTSSSDLKFKLEEGNMDDAVLQNSANTQLQYGISRWSAMIQEATQLSFNEFGFSAYNY